MRAASSPKKEKALKELRELRAEVAQAKEIEATLQARLEALAREVRPFEMWSGSTLRSGSLLFTLFACYALTGMVSASRGGHDSVALHSVIMIVVSCFVRRRTLNLAGHSLSENSTRPLQKVFLQAKASSSVKKRQLPRQQRIP